MSLVLPRLSSRLPRLPIKCPTLFMPEIISSTVVAHILNTILAPALNEGELDFLENRSVSFFISNIDFRFALGLDKNKLTKRSWRENDDLNISGKTHDFLLLATRTEDADTLFFQRKLKMTGNTELGLEVKNLLDGLDNDSVRFRKQIDTALGKALSIHDSLIPSD